MMMSLTTTTTRLWSQALKVFKNLELRRCASSVARCIPPAINVCILKNLRSRTISSWIFVPKSLGNSSTHTALQVFYPKKYCYKSLVYLKCQSKKNLPFPRIENLTKIIPLE
jgi:hypothetical protein